MGWHRMELIKHQKELISKPIIHSFLVFTVNKTLVLLTPAQFSSIFSLGTSTHVSIQPIIYASFFHSKFESMIERGKGWFSPHTHISFRIEFSLHAILSTFDIFPGSFFLYFWLLSFLWFSMPCDALSSTYF